MLMGPKAEAEADGNLKRAPKKHAISMRFSFDADPLVVLRP